MQQVSEAGLDKAAALLKFLGAERAREVLNRLPENQRILVSAKLESLDTVDVHKASAIYDEARAWVKNRQVDIPAAKVTWVHVPYEIEP